jgi:peptidoglycan/xylan/chitin deacetylase (PgdA/CDA1 family)
MVPALRRRAMPATLYCDTQNLESGQPVPHVMMRYLRLIYGDMISPPQDQALQAIVKDSSLAAETRLRATYEFAGAIGADVLRYERDRVFSYMNEEELRLVARAGIDVQLHSHTHNLHDLSFDAISGELSGNRHALARALDRYPSTFQHFCYPSGRFGGECAAILEENNVLSSTTTVLGLANQNSHLQLLPRILDGENVSSIEFEAELSGFMEILRAIARSLRLRKGQISVRTWIGMFASAS